MNDSTSSSTTKFPNDSITIVPASRIQRQFWLLAQMQKEGSAYNIVSVFELDGQLDEAFIEESFNEIIARHEALRTTFTVIDGEIVQKIQKKLIVPLRIKDLHPPNTNEQQLEQILVQEATRPFNLENGPLVRVLLLRLSQTRYILSIVLHHIITDLKSKQLFGQELSALYHNKTAGLKGDFTTPPSSYSEYASRHQEWLKTPESLAMTRYWQKELIGQSGVLNLPLDFSRPTNLSDNGNHCSFILSKEQTAILMDYSKEKAVDIFVTLLTAYLVILARYCNQKQLIIGVPLSNRRHVNDKETMGAFVNIVPLSFDLTEITDFDSCLKLVRLKMLHAHRHQETPFEEIVNVLKPKRDPSYNPIFQVGFTVEPLMKLALTNIEVTPLHIHNQGAQLDMFLNIKELGPEITGYFEYNTDLFKPTTIERLKTHFLNLLCSVPHQVMTPLNLLPMISEAERSQIISDFNQTETPYPEVCLSTLIEEQVTKQPNAIAALFEGEKLTYSELNARANQLAHMLREKGVTADSLVGVYLTRSLEMLIAICAIHKAGGAYVPLDTEFPVHRIGQMLEDAQPGVILSQSEVVMDLPENPVETICLDSDSKTISSYPDKNPVPVTTPENLAYVIFTSGSTGRPKGVQVPQRAMVNFLWSMKQEPGITSADTLLAVTTLSFDISVLELFLPLLVGARIEIASSSTAKDGQALYSLMKASNTTIIQATPTTFHLLIGAGWDSPLPVKVLCGGELFPQDLANQLCQRADSVWNMYGPTETTVWSTVYKVALNQPVLVGRPIANTQVYIVNDENQPTPIGVAGELLIGGDGVTNGYLHRQELNRKQFIKDTFKPDSKFKVYRTGDLACFLETGEIKILGRLDHQIKIRGFRIELGEIETAIIDHPEVKEGVAKTHDFGGGDIRLSAYVTLHDNKESISLTSFLKERLPDYMVPSLVTVLEEMPLTLNNKIDRKALPEPDMSRSSQAEKLLLPQNKLETTLAQKWAVILKLEQIGVDETFFDLGGNSLLSLQLIAQLEHDLQIKIPVVKFYQYPTVRLLAGYLDKIQEQSQKEPLAESTQSHNRKNSFANRAKLQQQALAKIRQRAKK